MNQAPSDLAQWRASFILELRLRDVSGASIADALAEVESHCAETGEEAPAAFGDPVSYAATLVQELPEDARRPPPAVWLGGAVGGACVVSTGMLLTGISGLASDGPAVFSSGAVLTGIVIAGALAFTGPALAWLARPRLRVAVLAVVALLLALPVVGQLLLPGTAFTASASGVAVAGAVLLLATGAALIAVLRSDRDLLVDPRTGQDRSPAPRWLGPVAFGLLPVVLLVAAVAIAATPTR